MLCVYLSGKLTGYRRSSICAPGALETRRVFMPAFIVLIRLTWGNHVLPPYMCIYPSHVPVYVGVWGGVGWGGGGRGSVWGWAEGGDRWVSGRGILFMTTA